MIIKIDFCKFKIVTLIFFISVSICSGQPEKLENIEKSLKYSVNFENWSGKDSLCRNGINLSKTGITSLSNAIETRPKSIFFIAKDDNGKDFVQYSSKWTTGDNSFMEITLFFLNSGIEAQEFLFSRFVLGSTLPLEIREKGNDNPLLVGNISLFNGTLFVRNNIIVKIHCEGNLQNKLLNVSKEIDELLLSQKIGASRNILKPYIVKNSKGGTQIIEP